VGAKATIDLDLWWPGALQYCVCGVVMCVMFERIREIRKCISRKRGACMLYLQYAGCRDCVQRHMRIEKVRKRFLRLPSSRSKLQRVPAGLSF
jgi:hypothetical protein